MLKLPYGISNFKMLREMGYFYQDRSQFLSLLDSQPTLYHLFLRPRKFGKTLFLSMLDYYYGIEHKGSFEQLFGDLFIGKNPTAQANSFLILRLDFSAIDSSSFENTYAGFRRNVLSAARDFISRYPDLFNSKIIEEIEQETMPESILKSITDALKQQKTKHKIFLLVDEYDQFANELLSFNQTNFKDSIGRNGFVRKFYETVKVATAEGLIGRIFLTGVSPVAIDALTSGFNIITDLTLKPAFNEMIGFTHPEAASLLLKCGISEEKSKLLIADLMKWYNGYKFSTNAVNSLFNSNMLIYFIMGYFENSESYPNEMLDSNVLSDYQKIQKIFEIGAQENERYILLEKILNEGYIDFDLVYNFSTDAEFTEAYFLSLLFYLGMLTIKEQRSGRIRFIIPNYVIKQLYFEYFNKLSLKKSEFPAASLNIGDAVDILVNKGNPEIFLKLCEKVIKTNYSNRDSIQFDEKHLKTMMIGLLIPFDSYMIHSEYETDRIYPDIFLERVPGRKMIHEVVIELKYLQKKDKKLIDEKCKSAKFQLNNYLETTRFNKADSLGIWAVFCGSELSDWGTATSVSNDRF